LTARQKAELNALVALSDEQINTRALPDVRDWSGTRRGAFFRPIKKQVGLRRDADVIDWLKTHPSSGRRRQDRISGVVRKYVARLKAWQWQKMRKGLGAA
jgi:uncharacterized protein (DUF4415 family)